VKDPVVTGALKRATEGMLARMQGPYCQPGHYCCCKCSVALWRHLAAGGLKAQDRELAAGMKRLKTFRDGLGRWRSYPFNYTLLALSEIDTPLAIQELRYAAPSIKLTARRAPSDKYGQRRKDLAERILAKI